MQVGAGAVQAGDLDGLAALGADESEDLLERVRVYERAATEQVEKLCIQLSRAEDFAATLRSRLEQHVPAIRT